MEFGPPNTILLDATRSDRPRISGITDSSSRIRVQSQGHLRLAKAEGDKTLPWLGVITKNEIRGRAAVNHGLRQWVYALCLCVSEPEGRETDPSIIQTGFH